MLFNFYFIFLFPRPWDFKGLGGERNYWVVCSCSQLHSLSQTVFSFNGNIPTRVSQDVRPPRCCAVLPTNTIEETLWQGKGNKIVLLFLSGLCFIVPATLFSYFLFEREKPIFGLSFDIMYTFLLPDAPLWFALCVSPPPPPPVPLAMWLNGLLSSAAASPPPSTHKYIDYVSHKVHSADEDH